MAYFGKLRLYRVVMERLKMDWSKPVFYFLVLAGLFLLNCNHPDERKSSNNVHSSLDSKKDETAVDSKQIIIAYSKNKRTITGKLFGLELIEGNWEVTFDSIPCSFGRNGIADPTQKIEGDGKTPSGTFQIGSAFGYKNDLVGVSVDFLELTENHYWISDPNSEMYNKLVNHYPEGIYAEKMRRKDHLYQYGIVVEYNTKDIVKGKGSAIFIHVERKKGAPTAGCIAISNESIKKLIQWINPEKNPLIIIGVFDEIDFETYGSPK